MEKIYILDATGYLFRSYYAIGQMTNPEGKSTNALYGFIRSVLKLINDFSPEHIVAVFDGPNNGLSRTKLYPQYKAHRGECPPDLGYQIGWAADFCDYMGIPKLIIPEVEADDTMGTVARWAEKQRAEAFLCTSDKDLCQLVDDHIKVLITHKDNKLLGPKEVEETYGVPPKQMIDYLAILGDTSDNVPGLPGFGPKTAAALLKEHHSLQALIDNPDVLKGKKKETLEENIDLVKLSKKLVTIDTAIPIPHEETFFQLKDPNQDQLSAFYKEMNFLSLLREVKAPEKKESVHVQARLIDDRSSFEELLKQLSQQTEICFDTETTGTRPLLAELVGLGFCFNETETYYVPVNGELGLETVLKALKPLFENPRIGFYAHNIKYDYHILKNYDITVANICFDTIVASYVLNAHSRQHSLDILALEYFNKTKIPISDLIGKGKTAITMREVPIEKVCAYCCEDVEVTYKLKHLLSKQLKERNLEQVFYDIELPLIEVLATIERNGIFLDIPYTQKMSKEVGKQLETLEQDIYRDAGEEFNLNSPKQLSVILFENMGIRPPKKTATGFSTNAEVLENLSADYPIAKKIIDYRTYAKLKSTYLDTLPEEVNPKTRRIHCTFNQSVAATGRLSSQDPNLQNIPVRSEIGRKIRGAFRPEKEGYSFLSADYSQIELRLLAHLSEDPNLIDGFKHNRDVHAHTAAAVFGIPLEQVTSEQRYQAKAVNFGVIYGQQAFGLSKELGIGMKDASSFIETYFARYPKVKTYVEQCKELAREKGKATTLTGRERIIPEIHNKNMQIRSAAERLAVNTPLQGTAADLIKIAMIKLQKELAKQKLETKMILQIHDELIFELPDHEIEHLSKLVKHAMESVWELKVPLTVNITVGQNWEKC